MNLLPLLLCLVASAMAAKIVGRISTINDLSLSAPSAQSLLSLTQVVAIKTLYNRTSGQPLSLTYDQIYRYTNYNYTQGTVDVADGSFEVDGLQDDGQTYYSLFLFSDVNRNGKWDPDEFEPCGWNWLYDVTSMPIPTLTSTSRVWTIPLNSGMGFTNDDVRSTRNGAFAFINGLAVLHTWGNPTERAFAHGYLLARRIIGLFRFWVIETTTPNLLYYETAVIPFVATGIAIPPIARAEMEAGYAGVLASGVPLWVPELGRNFSSLDFIYINNYGVQPPTGPSPSFRRMSDEHCSQLSAWGDRTNGRGTITGRNMDGELDIRKTTVSLFVVMAVEPSDPEELAYINFGWPGFVSAMTSGFNEMGLHAMLNSGYSWQPGPPPNATQAGMILNAILRTMGCHNINETKSILPFEVEVGPPTFVIGVNLMLAQADTIDDGTAPAVVYEGDRLGGVFRFAKDANPYVTNVLVTTNHFMKYGYTLDQPYENFGEPLTMSTWWRYFTGSNFFLARDSTQTPITVDEMEKGLQSVCHGTTEHSVVTMSNTLQFKVATARMGESNFYGAYALNDAVIMNFWDVFFGKGGSPKV